MPATRSFVWAAAVAVGVWASSAGAQADKKDVKKEEKKKDAPPPPAGPTATTGMFPAGGAAGKTVAVAVEGVSLAGATTLWFEHPGITGKITAAADAEIKAQVTIAADVPPGLYAWRVAAPRGVSNPRRFAVTGSAPEVNEVEPNDEIDKAQAVPAGATVNARLDKYDDMDCFKVAGKAGQRLVAVCRCRALGSAAEIALALVDSKGRLIATPRQSDVVEGDPVLDATLPEAGDYVVQAWNLVRGDDRSRIYRLSFGNAPTARYAYPAGVQRGKPTEISVGVRDPAGKLGGRLPGSPFTEVVMKVSVPADHPGAEFPVRPEGGDPIAVAVSDLPEVNEVEPNDDPGKAGAVAVGTVVNGRLGVRGDLDHFSFAAKKGRTVVLEVASSKLGYPGDLALAVLDAKGTQLAANDDASATDLDPRLTFNPPDDGTFVVRVSEAVPERITGPEYVYRLAVRPPRPDFALTATNHTVNVGAGGTAVIPVQAVRLDGHAAPIALSLAGLPAEYKAQPATIAGGATAGAVAVKVPDGTAGKSFAVRITGESEVDGRPARRTAIATATLVTLEGKAANTLRTPAIFLSVGNPPPISLSAAPDKVETVPGGAFTVKVSVKRAPTATGPIDLSVAAGPDGTAAVKGQIAAGANSADLAFKLTPKAGGTASLLINAVTKVGPETVTVPVPPVSVTAASYTASLPVPAVTVVRGATVNVPVTVSRQAGFTAPVTVAITGLPKGFRADAVTVPPDKKDGVIVVGAPAEAATGPVPKLKAAATATVGGTVVPVDAGPLTLTVADVPFAATVADAKVEAKPGATVEVKLKVARTAPFADAVTISVTADTLPAGWKAAAVTVPPGQNEAVLKIELPAGVKPGDTVKLALEIGGKVGGAALKAPAGTVRVTAAN